MYSVGIYCLNVFFMEVSDKLNVSSRCLIEGVVLIAPLALAVMTMSGSTFHPPWMRLLFKPHKLHECLL
jgi:hypothetical protein